MTKCTCLGAPKLFRPKSKGEWMEAALLSLDCEHHSEAARDEIRLFAQLYEAEVERVRYERESMDAYVAGLNRTLQTLSRCACR